MPQPNPQPDEGIRIQGVTKSFGTTQILRGIDLHMRQGEFLSLVGPSGCGKTTLLRIVAGLEQADSGTVQIAGRDVTTLHPAARDVAMVFQNYALYPHLTVAQNMAVPLAMRRLTLAGRIPLLRHLMPGQAAASRAIAAEVAATARLLGLGHLLDRRPAELSGGQRQRVALGRAVVRHPAAFLMDEPLSNLDAELRARTRTEIVELHRRAGVTTVYVTHDQVEAMTMSDRVALMQGGQLLQVGPPRELYEAPDSLAVAQFLGSPRLNALSALSTPEGLVAAGTALKLHAGVAPGTEVTIGLRPEALRLDPAGALPVLATHVEYLGAEALLHATFAGQAVIARLSPDAVAGIRPGDALRLGFDPAAALLFGPGGTRLRPHAHAAVPHHA